MFKLLSSLAFTDLKKNRALYFPFSLTVITMVIITYLLQALSKNPEMENVFGGGGTAATMTMGVFVMRLVSLLTILYANSFVMKNRSKELGLYSILGLDRVQIQWLTFMETALFALLSTAIGLGLGIVFNRLAFALLVKAMRYPIPLAYSFQWESVLKTLLFFAIIFGIVVVVNAFRVQSSRPLELLKAKKQGETKGRFILVRALIGTALLVAAYWISQSVISPLKSLYMFFLAVILVIIATYILFDAGSITFLQLLKRKKAFYYQPTNFISVSNLIFRMRKNAAGLASICILSTMVLVTISFTAALQIGADHLIDQQYPAEYEFQTLLTDGKSLEDVRQQARTIPQSSMYQTSNYYDFSYIYTAGSLKGDTLDTVNSSRQTVPEAMIQLIPVSDYNAIMKENLSVPTGTVVVGDNSLLPSKTNFSKVQLGNQVFQVTEGIDAAALARKVPASPNVTDHNYYAIMNDADMDAITKEGTENQMIRGFWAVWDSNAETDEQKNQEAHAYGDYVYQHPTLVGGISYKSDAARMLFSFYGSLLFLGVLLSIAFLVGAVLVIYYKQVSEGFEDRDRYVLLKKIGINQSTIHQSINRQVLIVFFLPLLTAFLHTAMAYKMISKIVLIFGIETRVVWMTMVLAGVIFMGMYLLIYRITSRSYYRIINR